MDLSRHLRYFLTVAEELHFGRAAELIGIAQPPLSQSIQRLERELGVRLFDRSRRQIGLTAAGALLATEARDLLAAEQRIRAVMRLARDGTLGPLRAGVLPETPAVALQAILHRLTENTPGLTADLHELTSAEQLRALAEARLDVGIVHHPIDAPDLVTGPIATVPLGVVIPRTSPLARLAEIPLPNLSGHELILAPRATAPGWYDHLLATCQRNGFSPTRLRHARNPEFLLGLVLAGQGVAFQPEHLTQREPRVAWRPLTGRPLLDTRSAVWPRRSPHPLASTFGKLAADILDTDRPDPAPLTAGGPPPWTTVYSLRDNPGRPGGA